MPTLQKLSEEALTRPPEEVFDMICKLGTFIIFIYVFTLNLLLKSE